MARGLASLAGGHAGRVPSTLPLRRRLWVGAPTSSEGRILHHNSIPRPRSASERQTC